MPKTKRRRRRAPWFGPCWPRERLRSRRRV